MTLLLLLLLPAASGCASIEDAGERQLNVHHSRQRKRARTDTKLRITANSNALVRGQQCRLTNRGQSVRSLC
jgi:hypothetical protein